MRGRLFADGKYWNVQRKATKEEISAVLEDTEIERIYMMMRWKDPEDGTRREQLGEYMVGMIATNWARWMGICHDQVETLQVGRGEQGNMIDLGG